MTHAHRNPVRQATIEVLSGLIPLVDRLGPQRSGHGFAGRNLLLTMVAGVLRPRVGSDEPTGGAAALRSDLARLRARLADMVDTDDAAPATRRAYLEDFVGLALSREDMPADKLARWVGYVEGCMEARGANSLFLEWDGRIIDAVYEPDLVDLSRFVGFVQGVLAARGALDVRAERDRTRPIFHAAYEAVGIGRPQTIEVAGR